MKLIKSMVLSPIAQHPIHFPNHPQAAQVRPVGRQAKRQHLQVYPALYPSGHRKISSLRFKKRERHLLTFLQTSLLPLPIYVPFPFRYLSAPHHP
jgi:hypothetical protein